MDGLFDVGVDAPALGHGGDDGGEVVVGEDHVGGPLGHVGAGDPHGAADVGGLEGGGVVDPVAGHGHHLAPALPGPDDAHLVLGGHPGVDRELLHLPLQHFLGHEVQILSGDGQVSLPADTQLPGDGHRRQPVVAGNHNGSDAGGEALFHRPPHLRPGRVDHADEPGEGKSLLQGVGVQGGRRRGQVLEGGPQYPQGPGGHILVGGGDLPAEGGGELRRPRRPQRLFAPAQQHVGGPLHHHPHSAAGQGVYGGHELALRVKGQLAPAGRLPLQGVFVDALLPGGPDQSGFGGVPGGQHLPGRREGQHRVVAQRGDGEGLRPVLLSRRPHVHHRHPVLGEGAGLVGADDPGAAQGLHSGEPLDDGVAARHALHPQGQHDGDDGGQALGNGGHRQGDGGHEHVQNLLALEESHPEHDGADAQADKGEGLGDLCHLPLEGGGGGLLVHEKSGDAPHLGVHAGAGDHCGAPAGGDDGGGDDHVAPVGQGGVWGQAVGGDLGYRGRLPGHGRLVGLQVGALQDPGVGGDQVPGLQPDEVAGDQPGALHPDVSAVPHGLGHGGGHLPQGLQGLLGVVLLGDGDEGVDHHDDQNDDGVDPVLSPAGPEGQGGGGEQHQDHGVLHLAQKPGKKALPLLVLQLVGPVLLQPPLGLGLAQAPAAVGAQLVQHLGGGLGVPCAHRYPSLLIPCPSLVRPSIAPRLSGIQGNGDGRLQA